VSFDPSPWGQNRKPRKASPLGRVLWLSALISIGVLLWVLTNYFPGADSTPLNSAYTVRLIAILALMSSGLLFIKDSDLKKTAKNILLWVGIAGCLMLGYSYQSELSSVFTRLRSGLIPGYPVEVGPREAVLSESDGGNYLVYGTVNGTRVLFMIDTGASDIVLSPSDAKRAGIDMGALNFDHAYETANGIGRGAKYQLASLSVGPLVFSNVPISVNQANMSTSLLGMAFLSRLKSFAFGQKKLILR
jgi:aspartyl protease family protein